MGKWLRLIFIFAIHLVIFNTCPLTFGNDTRKEINPVEKQKVSSPLFNIISVDLENIPFEKALLTVAREGRFKLNYKRSLLPVHEKITLKMSNVPAIKVLQMILNTTGIELKIIKGGHFVIVPKKNKGIKHGTIVGKIYEHSNHKNIPGVQVLLLNTKFFTLSDENGEFTFFNVPEGKYDIKMFSDGFKTLIKENIIVRSNRITYIKVEMDLQLPQVREIVNVMGGNDSNVIFPARVFHLKREEIYKTPGTIGGISRTLRMMPGISSVSDVNNDLIIRGGSPLENGFYIDNIEIPTINHLPKQGSTGGFYSALNSELIQNVDFFSGGFSSDYGDRLSSIIDITLREGNREKFKGQTDISMAIAGGVLEGPIKNKGSWLISFRESHLGLMRDLGFDLDTVPETFDSQVKLSFDITSMQKLCFLNFYSKGTFQEENRDLPILHNRRYNQNTAGFNLTSLWSNSFFSNTSIFYTSLNRNDGEKFGPYDGNRDSWKLNNTEKYIGLRNINFLNLNEKNKLTFGFQIRTESDRFEYLIYNQKDENNSSIIPIKRMNFGYQTTKYSLFFTYQNSPFKNLTGTIGIRGDYSSNSGIFLLSPRLNLSYKATNHLVLFGGLGVFRQAVPINYLASIPQDIKVEDMKAIHYTLGVEYSTNTGTKIHLDAYYKEYENLPINPDLPYTLITDGILNISNSSYNDSSYYIVPSSIENKGSGYSKGIELLIQEKLVKNFYCMMSVTYFRSRYRDLLGVLRDRMYDNRFVFNLIAGCKVKPGFEFNVRWTVLGGAPYTPVDIKKSIELNKCLPDQSKFLGERYPIYSTFNVRIDKRFNLQKSALILYLDLWNAFNRDNVFYYMWKRSQINIENQLHILPVFGIKYEF